MDSSGQPKKAASTTKPTYISSSGHILEQPPFSARISRLGDDIYNFLGLYFVSLLSLDPYTAAQNSQFNTRGRANAYQERPRWTGGINRMGLAGGGATGAARPGGGGGSGGGSGSGSGASRRIATVDDVRGPECGSCG